MSEMTLDCNKHFIGTCFQLLPSIINGMESFIIIDFNEVLISMKICIFILKLFMGTYRIRD